MNLSYRQKAATLWLAVAVGGLLLYAIHLTMHTAGIIESKQHPILPELFWYFAVVFALPVQIISLLVLAKSRISITNINGIIYLFWINVWLSIWNSHGENLHGLYRSIRNSVSWHTRSMVH